MKISVTSIAKLALLNLAAVMAITAVAQNSSYASSSAINLSGTSWSVVETDPDASRDIFNFMPDGTLAYSYQNGSYTNGTWKQDGDSIYIEMNHKFVEYKGRITGTHIEGTAANIKGESWTWTADLRSSSPSAYSAQSSSNPSSISGTTWIGPDTMGRHYTYVFHADGTLTYSYENGSYSDGTWRQDGDSIYMSMNNKYSERQGRITGTHMEGKAWNKVGKNWTWIADLRSSSPPADTTQSNSSTASVSGTGWIGPDTMGRYYTYEFHPDGTLTYAYENGTFSDGTWKQDGDSIYMSMNNKYSERQGRITGTHMEGKAWNKVGKNWTWQADKQ
jgi:hypothetical protein